MSTPTDNNFRLAETLNALRREVARLGERVAALEAAAGRTSTAPPPLAANPAPTPPAASAADKVPAEEIDGLSEDLILVIGAAVAAFLGKRAPIRGIRLLGSAAWAQQGRVTIQASHALAGQHH
jgi:methylmalonyl-CoA carboxyltransferase large subunit